MGISAIIVGTLNFFIPLSLEVSVSLFAILSLVSVVIWKMYAKKKQVDLPHTTLNRRGEQYIGRTLTLKSPIKNGFGREKIDDSFWKIAGPDLPAQSKVEIVGAEGSVLKIAPK
jgi:membrane protein implicated in regulation of membrane protease activity